MGEWYKVRVLRKNKVFTVNLNETFNIEEKSNMINWENPQFMYSYVKLKSNGQKFDSALNLTGTYPNYKFTSDIIMSNDSIIKVYAFEGDGDSIPKEGSVTKEWKQIQSLGKYTTVTLNKDNDFTVDLKQYSNGISWGEVETFVSIKSILIHPFFREINFNVINMGNSIYKISPTLKGCTPVEYYLTSGNNLKSSYTVSLPKFYSLYIDTYGYARNDTTLSFFINNNVIQSEYITRGSDEVPNETSRNWEYYQEEDKDGDVTIEVSNNNIFEGLKLTSYESKNIPVPPMELNCYFLEVN